MNFRTYVSNLTKVLSYFFFPFVICAIGYDLWHMVNVAIYWIAVLIYGFLYSRPWIHQWRQDQFKVLSLDRDKISEETNLINCDKEQVNSFSTPGKYVKSKIIPSLF